jgi:hypothetical protein
LYYKIIEATILLHGSSLELQSENVGATLGLFPCMSMATSNHYKLGTVMI